MHYISISFTHKNTDIALREKLAFCDENRKKEILRLIGSSENILESMVLSTCNRVEIFAICKQIESATRHILSSISIITLVDKEALELRADVYDDQGAIHHLFSVASSLDSLVIGETQIAGQLKEAFRFAYDNGDCGDEIETAIHFAFKCAAKIRTATQISKNPTSVSGVAVSKAKEIFGNLGRMTAVVIGAGEMATLAAKHLISSNVNVVILNRNIQKAQDLALKLGELASFDDLNKMHEYINRYPLIFAATSSKEPIITDKILEDKDFKRCFFDISVPRNINISTKDNIKVYAVDDLKESVKENIALREEQANEAYAILSKSVQDFFIWIARKSSVPTIKALRLHAKQIAETEIQKAIKKGYLKNSDKEEARKLIHQVFKAFLHTPSVRLKEQTTPEINAILENLFDIKINPLSIDIMD